MPPVSGDGRGALAIVLHTHMPYVEGFGTWPFGEEWLWEAMAACYLPLLELLDGGAPLTLSLTPVLCDQLEAPGIAERFEDFIERVRRETHAEDAAGLRAGGEQVLADEVERSWQDYASAPAALRRRGGELLRAFAPHVQWTSSATHAVLPLLASDGGISLQVQTGVQSHRRRFGDGWRGGFWLPECAYAPWLDDPLEGAGVGAVCVELTGRFGLGAPEHLRPLQTDAGVLLVPIDRATISLVWSPDGYPAAGPYRDYHHHTVHHHNPWSNEGAAYDHVAATRLARAHAEDFVARALRRLEQAGGGDRLLVCALDTELLGHWWYEGLKWLEAVIEECERRGLELVRLDDALEQLEPAPAPADQADWAPCSWGEGGDLSTWSGPAVAELAFQTRAAELDLLAHARLATAPAVRELLALQASDWAFMIARGLAGPYPHERFEGHRRAFRAADAAGAAGRPSGSRSESRNLAPHANPPALLGARSARLLPAHLDRLLAHPDQTRRHAAQHGVRGEALGDDRARAHDRVVAQFHPPQNARAVADPAVVADGHVALVDPLQADRALDLGRPVVEVDQHDPVGDDALASDRDALVGRHGALLADHRLRADARAALVDADLAAVADPRPAPDMQRRLRSDLERDARADEAEAVGLQALAETQLQPAQPKEQEPITQGEHLVCAHESQQCERPAVQRRGCQSDAGRHAGRPILGGYVGKQLHRSNRKRRFSAAACRDGPAMMRAR